MRGIFDALYQMRGQENFQSAIWTLKMRGEVVGYLSIHPRDLDMIDNRDRSFLGTEVDPTVSSIRSETNGSVTPYSNTLEAGGQRVIVSVLVPRRPADLYGVLLNFLGTIVEAAENPSSRVIHDRFISNIEGSYIQVLIQHITWKKLDLQNAHEGIDVDTVRIDRIKNSRRFPGRYIPWHSEGWDDTGVAWGVLSRFIEADFKFFTDPGKARER